ncbi:helix-turn-helix domain-containing protein [Streptococcus catagoni]|uniref:helix-turn-helix domain-containing protein n=1 Tax=Streptococcus catagoni TaxID=2654874 RepID=UPI00140D4399|nr:helix-turn-helix domain-containing protein [Streptococcus catagoni]
MELENYFPEMQASPFPMSDEEWITVEKDETCLHFPKDKLSQRELALLDLIAVDTNHHRKLSSIWYSYLVDKKGPSPEGLESCQFIYINHQSPLAADFIQILSSVLPHVVELVPLSQKRTVILTDISLQKDSFSILQGLLPTLESDFGMPLAFFVGNEWQNLPLSTLRECFEEENTLFSAYFVQKGKNKMMRFSELMLWSLLNNLSLPAISMQFNHYMLQNPDLTDVITSMWNSHGNLVQAAQKLYIHRNSLQYKLDKLRAQTGLNLKNLDDLAFAYLFLLKQ